MSNADELFEEMGYVKVHDKNHIYYNNRELDCTIEFDLNRRLICIGNEDNYVSYCTMQELKAINKKCEELGWLQ